MAKSAMSVGHKNKTAYYCFVPAYFGTKHTSLCYTAEDFTFQHENDPKHNPIQTNQDMVFRRSIF